VNEGLIYLSVQSVGSLNALGLSFQDNIWLAIDKCIFNRVKFSKRMQEKKHRGWLIRLLGFNNQDSVWVILREYKYIAERHSATVGHCYGSGVSTQVGISVPAPFLCACHCRAFKQLFTF